MSRHRNVRNMKYNEEYDEYYNVYGHSVEEDLCVSPSTASEFIYDRNAAKTHSMSAFLGSSENDVQEEEEEDEGAHSLIGDCFNGHQLKLSQPDKVKLHACVEAMQNVVGDTIPEATLRTAALQYDYNTERALNAVLNFSENQPKPQRAPKERTRDRRGRQEAPKDHALQTKAQTKEPTISEEPAVTTEGIGRLSFMPEEETKTKKAETSSTSQKNMEISEMPENDSVNESKSANDSKKDKTVKMEISDGSSCAVETPKPSRSKTNKKDLLAVYEKKKSSVKPLINLVVIGHVDAGKSTLMGHLLFRLGCVGKKAMHKYEQDSKKLGKASFMYAWVLDETSEERTRGITMDVAQSKFETPHRLVTLLDAPGHKDFIPNMITGAAQADVAVLVVDATRGEFETGFETGGQTREHTLLVRSLGVSQLAVVVNKLDNVDWSQDRYDDIVSKLSIFLKQAGFKENDVTYVPCSGLTGENLTQSVETAAVKSWYNGPCLVEVIDNFKPPDRPVSRPFRLSVSDVFKGMGAGFSISGRIEAGCIQNGDRVMVMPSGDQPIVKGISIDDASVSEAFAGDHVALQITGMDMNNVTVGAVVCDINHPIRITTRFQARVVTFNIDIPITKGFPVVLHYQSMCEQAVVYKLISQLHKSTGQVVKKKPRCLTKNSSGMIELEVSRPICVELYKDYRDLGRFMLRSGGTTIAAGLVTEIL